MQTIYIRVDMNPIIATGHIMRCLSIADEIRALGGNTIFISADDYPVQLLEERGFESIVLNSNSTDMECELPQMIDLIRKQGIGKLIVDSYDVTETYLQTLREYTTLIYLDDVDAFSYPVDALICYANYYSVFSYGKRTQKEGYYLGTEYVPLRKVFRNCQPKEIREKVSKILLLSGGTDLYHIIDRMVEKFKDRTDVTLITICGRYYEGFEQLKNTYKEYPNLEFYQNVSNLEEYMLETDLAISAGGTTLYELCAVGTPTISYSFADNQLYNVRQFAEDEVIDYAGDVRTDDIFANVVKLYEKYNKDKALREMRSQRMQHMVDGKGAERIAQALLQ